MSGQLLDKSIGRGRSEVGTWSWFSISKRKLWPDERPTSWGPRRGSNEPEGTVRHGEEEDDDDAHVDGMGWPKVALSQELSYLYLNSTLCPVLVITLSAYVTHHQKAGSVLHERIIELERDSIRRRGGIIIGQWN